MKKSTKLFIAVLSVLTVSARGDEESSFDFNRKDGGWGILNPSSSEKTVSEEQTQKEVEITPESALIPLSPPKPPVEETPLVINAGQYARTEKEYLSARAAWFLSNYSDAFACYGSQDAPWSPDALKFIQDAVSFCEAPVYDSKIIRFDLLNSTAQDLFRKGCHDPFVIAAYGDVLLKEGKRDDAYKQYMKALPKFQFIDSCKFQLVRYADRIAELAPRDASSSISKIATNIVMKALPGMIVSGEFKDDQLNIAYREISSLYTASADPEFWRNFSASLTSLPAGSPWLLNVCRARAAIDAADSQMTPEDILKLLQDAYDAGIAFPEAPALVVKLRDTHPSFETAVNAYFNKAVYAQLDYMPVYDWLLSLRAQSTDIHALEEIGMAAFDTGRFDTDVPAVYIKSLIYIAKTKENCNWRSVFRQPDVFARFEQLYNGYFAEAVSDAEKARINGRFAVLYAWSGHFEEARALLMKKPLFKDNPVAVFAPLRVPWMYKDIKELEGEIRAFTGPHKQIFVEWDELFCSGRTQEAFEMMMKILPLLSNDRYARDFLRDLSMWSIIGVRAVDIPSGEDSSPLIYALKTGRQDLARLLLENGAFLKVPKSEQRYSEPPLVIAIRKGYVVVAKLLMQRGADTDSPGEDGMTPLIAALNTGNRELVLLLMNMNASCTGKINSDGRTVLHLAAASGWNDVISQALKRGAQVDSKDKNGNTALHVAAMNGRMDTVRLLVRSGADPAALNSSAQTPAAAAEACAFADIAGYLNSLPVKAKK